ncbi:tail assembly chaperone [Mycobacterium phage 40AC]|uniref:Tail assembly chaperone n=1 Tax=Mycobacterium phage 40AC TaxID=1458717 RepID=W8ECI8_9CAUD|nr:tail assembly chaperone [Mycobacterium phage 40AC]AHJ86392.1 tail assembly chaperone [Mycobacterium phage 40AC]
MSNAFTLDAIREATIRRYAPVQIELSDETTVELKPLLKLREKDRKVVLEAIKEINEIEESEEPDDDDEEFVAEWAELVCDAVEKVFRLIANKPKKLLAELDHDDPQIKANLYTAVLSRWVQVSQLGGSRVLAGLIDKHGEAILSDLLHYYRVDIRDLFSEENPLSPRYVLALIVWLPTDSAFAASCRGGPQFRGWDADRYAMVSAVNELRAGNHLTLLINRDRSKPKPKAPEPFPTPDEEKKSTAPKPGSFASMVVAAKRAARLKKEKESAKQRGR